MILWQPTISLCLTFIPLCFSCINYYLSFKEYLFVLGFTAISTSFFCHSGFSVWSVQLYSFWITNQLLQISSQVTNFLSYIFSESAVRDKWFWGSVVMETYRLIQGSNQWPLEYKSTALLIGLIGQPFNLLKE